MAAIWSSIIIILSMKLSGAWKGNNNETQLCQINASSSSQKEVSSYYIGKMVIKGCSLYLSRSWTMYSKVSIKRPVLLNDLVWIFQKSLYLMTRSISEKIDRTVLFQGCHGQFLVSIKWPGLDIWKKSLLNDQYYLFFKF